MAPKPHKVKKRKEYKSSSHYKKDGCKVTVHFPCAHCNNDFRLNFAGLTNNLNFQLIKFKDCEIEIDTNLDASDNNVRGKISGVGIDFIDIKEETGTIVTILKDKISQIRWLDEDYHSNI